MSLARKLLRVLVVLVLAVVVAVAAAWALLRAPRPEGGVTGPGADALARRLQTAVNLDAWNATGAVTWTHAGRNEHLWDRRRGFDRVRLPGGVEVLLDIARKDGIAFAEGRRLDGEEAKAAIDKGYRWWVNDSFWLNPMPTLFDEGVVREKISNLADEPGSEGLLVRYGSGGVTPGDSYLWIVPADGPPRAWRMWVAVLPVGGARTAWEGWKALDTGAVVSTRHNLGGLMDFELGGVRAAATLAELTGGEDPFAALETAASRGPSSRPAGD